MTDNPERWLQAAQPLTPIDSATWDRMSGKERWDVMSALRGPDHDNPTLKWLTTAIIRHRMSGVIRVGGMINRVTGIIVLPESGRAKWVSEAFYAYHFFCHIRDAAQILNIPIHICDDPTYEAMMGRTTTRRPFEAATMVYGSGALALMQSNHFYNFAHSEQQKPMKQRKIKPPVADEDH